jgi:hypothetical protein
MTPFFGGRRDHQGGDDSPRPDARPRLRELAAEFARPAPPGLWTVHTESDPWRITDGHDFLQLLCDKFATVRRADGAVLFRRSPDVAATARPSLTDGLIAGVVNTVLGTDPTITPYTSGSAGGSNLMAPARWLIKDAAGVAVARIAGDGHAAQIDLLPAGPLNARLIAQRLPPESVERIRALGPLRYSITRGDARAGTGQLSGPAGQSIAIDQFAYLPPVRRSGTMRSDLGSWTVEIINNPFPASWLFALLRSTK